MSASRGQPGKTMLLAIDTSTQLAGLALYDGEVRAELTWVAGRRHSAELFPEIERLLKLTGLEVGADPSLPLTWSPSLRE